MFTHEEKRVIIFLCSILLLGGLLRVFNVNKYRDNPLIKQEIVKININTATLEELQRIPSIGKEIAQKIISYRSRKGRISTLRELKEIKGIGDKRLKIISKFIIF